MHKGEVVTEFTLADCGLATVAEAAVRLKCAPETLQLWIRAGRIPAVKVGPGRGTLLVRLADVDAFERPPMGRPVGSGQKDAPPARAARKPKKAPRRRK